MKIITLFFMSCVAFFSSSANSYPVEKYWLQVDNNMPIYKNGTQEYGYKLSFYSDGEKFLQVLPGHSLVLGDSNLNSGCKHFGVCKVNVMKRMVTRQWVMSPASHHEDELVYSFDLNRRGEITNFSDKTGSAILKMYGLTNVLIAN